MEEITIIIVIIISLMFCCAILFACDFENNKQ